MSKSSSSSRSLGPLSVGNVISAALRIYRDHFLVYYKLALIAYLWIFIPIYGWAKFAAILGLISRLAYQEVIESPETVIDARRHTKPRLWTFFGTGFLVYLILVGFTIGYFIIAGVILGILAFLLQVGQGNMGGVAIIGLLAIPITILFFLGYLWIFVRIFFAEMPIAIESQSSSTQAISRSWQLTKGFITRIMLINFVAFLITIPISGFIQVLTTIFQVILTLIFPTDSPIFASVYLIVSLILALGVGALFIPFWQAIKSVIYYDLLSRQEGIDLQLRDV